MKYKIAVHTVPHPNPDAAIDLMAKIILKQIIKEQNSTNDKGA